MSTSINIKKQIAAYEEGSQISSDISGIDVTGDGASASMVGSKMVINVPGGIGNITYYLNQTVNQAPYKEFSSIPTAAAEQTISNTVAGTTTITVQSFQTASGVPGTTNIPGGLWSFYLHFSGTSGDNWEVYVEVYKRDLGGIETLLLTTDTIAVSTLSGTPTMILTDGVFPTSTVLTTDRIVVKVKVTNTDSTTNSITFHTEGSTNYSVATTTLNQTVPTGAVTSVSGSAPVVSSGGTTPTISMPQATGLVDGYLDSADFATFSAKQDPITLTTTGTTGAATFIANILNVPQYQGSLTLTTTGSSGAATLIANALNIPNYTLAGLGGVPTSRTLTINGVAQDLSADRTWSVGTVTSVTGTSPIVSSGGATPAISIPQATALTDGYLTAADWTTFNNKGNGTVTSVAALTLGTTGTDLSSTVATGTTTPVITLNVPTASATNRGALSSADWTTFNGKQDAITLTTTGTSGAATLIGNTLNIPDYSTVVTNIYNSDGTLSTNRNVTMNNFVITYDGGTNANGSQTTYRTSASNRVKAINFQVGSNLRWKQRVSGTELGADDGSVLAFDYYTDAGVLKGTALQMDRVTGALRINSAFNLPTADGTAGQVMTTNGAGVVSFQTPSSGSSTWTVTTQSGASYTAASNDYVLINAATHIVTLPAASNGIRVGVKMINATVTSIQIKTPSAGITIDGVDRSVTGLGIFNQYDAYTFVSDGTNWFIMG